MFTGPLFEIIDYMDLDVRCSKLSHLLTQVIRNRSTFTKYCLTQCISKLPGSFEIHWVRQYLVNFAGLAGIVNTNIWFLTLVLLLLQVVVWPWWQISLHVIGLRVWWRAVLIFTERRPFQCECGQFLCCWNRLCTGLFTLKERSI